MKVNLNNTDNNDYVRGYKDGKIAGATAKAERVQVLVDALEKIVSFLDNELRRDYLLSKIPKYNEYLEALQQWKEGKEVGNG